MEFIDHLLALTKHQNTAVSFIAYCILKFIRSAMQGLQHYLQELKMLLQPQLSLG